MSRAGFSVFYGVSPNALFGCSATVLRVEVPPNDPRQVRRWQLWRSARLTARDDYEKRHDSRAAPAASPARGCWAA